ncbi:MAG TPA: DUF4783 domain-containing protein [Cyclobacteriaceae bacterium]|nr:DUF4783 domain-containing protein [Cyclobacteriaceae bacterium]
MEKRKDDKTNATLPAENVNIRIGVDFDSADFMNKMFALGCVLLGIVAFTYLRALPLQNIEEISAAMQTGSSKSLARFFKDSVSLNISNNFSSYSKNQAEQILREFFRKYPCEEFKILHQDQPEDKSWHIIGQYSSVEETFKVLIKGLREDGKLSISSLEFTKE